MSDLDDVDIFPDLVPGRVYVSIGGANDDRSDGRLHCDGWMPHRKARALAQALLRACPDDEGQRL